MVVDTPKKPQKRKIPPVSAAEFTSVRMKSTGQYIFSVRSTAEPTKVLTVVLDELTEYELNRRRFEVDLAESAKRSTIDLAQCQPHTLARHIIQGLLDTRQDEKEEYDIHWSNGYRLEVTIYTKPASAWAVLRRHHLRMMSMLRAQPLTAYRAIVRYHLMHHLKQIKD